MVRTIKDQAITQDKHYIEAAGLSTDTKPGGVITGSLFLEVDTGDVYAFDETDTGSWGKVASLGGGA
jgi:hypothetical protein